MKKNKLKILTFSSSVVSIIAGASLPLTINGVSNNFLSADKNIINNNDLNNNDNSSENKQESKQLVPFDFNESWPLLVQNTGPIVSYQNKISSLDWFSSTRWSIDLLEATFNNQKIFGDSPTFVKWTDRAFINWALDRSNNALWLLTNSIKNGGDVQKQKFIKIDSLNGTILDVKELSYKPAGENWMYYSISVLESGNIMAYGQGNDKWEQFDILDTKTGQVTQKFSNSGNIDKHIEDDIKTTGGGKGDVRSRFLFSIAKNMNILVLTNFGWNGGQQEKEKFGDIYFAFVDDEMNRIQTGTNDEWFYAKKMIERTDMGKLNSESDTFPKLVYKLPDGRILFSIYNKLYVFFPNETEKQKKPVYKEFDYGVKDDTTGKYLPVESWTTDTDNNVYAKFSNDSKIQKISISGSTLENTNINISTYYNIDGNNDETIKSNANNFVLYNVYGYSGQIMMLNPRKITNKQDMKPSEQTELDKKGIGIAVAITKNKNGEGGDSKGYLNTDKAFVKSADFNIDQSILKNKLPSEISRNDLTITEGGFLTNNNTIDQTTNQLKYKQFEKTKIDDDKNDTDNLVITANIDQIPWFVDNNVMPGNIPPLTITKSFKTGVKISERTTWKNVELDYDFKNTLPSKITPEDVQRFDPFSINITSQNTRIGETSYPRKTYEIGEKNDQNGTIVIKAKFEYLPIDVDANETNVKTQTFEKTYNVFKSSDTKSFNFVGSNGNGSEDIKNIPQLKNLSESNLLPSSFQANDPSSILKFINTDTSAGYPISKMNFSITPNDNLGTLTISGSLPPGYYPDGGNQTFTKTYEGLNKTRDYSFNVKQTNVGFDKKKFRPSEIDEQIVYGNFIDYKGFNSSDLSLDLIPNDEVGDLTIRVHLRSDYPNNIATQWGFKKTSNDFIREDKITGFKTNDEYKTQYEVKFIDDTSNKLDGIKKFTPKQIEQSIKSKENNKSNPELVINGEKITTEEKLAKAVIEKLGSSLPKKENLTSENFGYNIYYNDPNGEITVKLTFKGIEGTNGDLVFIQRYTGFAKGNQVTTDDILSFKTQSKLMSDNPTFKTTLPSELAKLLQDPNKKIEEIKKYISYFSGAYVTAIDEGKFTLEVTADDIYGYLTIKINFDKQIVTDPNSLLSYTTTYNGFATE